MSDNFKLEYGTDRHRMIREAVLARECLSKRKMNNKHDDWRRAEEQALAYLPEKEMDAKRSDRRDSGEPEFTTLEVPYSTATLLAAHTYWTSVFLSRNPVFQFSARHGEPEMSVQALTALIDYQVQVGKLVAPLYIWLYDVGRYGVGVLGSYWENETRTFSRIEEVPVTYAGVPIIGQKQRKRITTTVPGFVGNKGFNVRPFDFRPDPRVSLNNIQNGEFCGRVVDEGWNALVRGQQSGKYYQIDKAKKSAKLRDDRNEGSSQLELPNEDGEDPFFLPRDVGHSELLEMYVELIPKDWKLGKSDRPEVWRFTIANEEVIIESRPVTLHGVKFPYYTLSYEFEGYARVSRGMMDIIKPLNDTLTWLFNSHMYNVRGSLNNNFIFDPTRVVAKDVMSDRPNKLIRVKPSAAGQDVRTMVSQLTTVDVTQGHIRDAGIVMDLIQRVSGVTDNIQGVVNSGGRKTATEVRSSNTFGVNRQKTLTEWWSACGFQDLAQSLVQNTQQMYDVSRQYKVAGDLMEWGERGLVNVSPEDIQGFFDFVPVDGAMPIDKFAQANLWREILAGLYKMPEVAQQFELARIFEWTAQIAGLKNIKQFRIQAVPDETIQRQVQAGNVVPVRDRDFGRPPEPGQIAGLGTT